MRHCLLVLLIACSGSSKPKTAGPSTPDQGPVSKPEPPAGPKGEILAADTPTTTVGGNTFIAPAGWKLTRGQATILTPPEGDSSIAFVDVQAKDADAAVDLAWAAYGKEKKWPLEIKQAAPDRDGWSKIQAYSYQTSPAEKRIVAAQAQFANDTWTVVIIDVAQATGEKRGSQFGIVFGQFLPKGGAKESFANKKANVIDKTRLAALTKFVEDGMKAFDVPGVGLGIVQDGKVVFAGGFGVRQLGKPAKVDGDTRFIIASNTKALTTLMLAKLVDEKKLTWDSPVTSLLPQFKLGDADTTSKVLVKHLICACTGLPRQDMEMIFESSRVNSPEKVLESLGKMQPTSKFGELFQYSNPMAAAAGYVGGHIAFPKLDLGKAYDEAMRTLVFTPLGMTNTTLDFKRAQTGDFSAAHGDDVNGKTMLAPPTLNNLVIPSRPAGGAWSTVRDWLKYVQMELDAGKLPNGKQYISKESLFARRNPQIAVGKDLNYGMGLMVSTRHDVTLIEHGGDIVGFHSNMIWLPDHNVGVVIVVNSDSGGIIRSLFDRKLLEVLFDGKPEADAELEAAAKRRTENIALALKQLTIPAAPDEAAKLAPLYKNEALGNVKVIRAKDKLTFDMDEWKSEIATKKNPDGTISFITISPGLPGVELLPGTASGKRTLVLRTPQQEYVFSEP